MDNFYLILIYLCIGFSLKQIKAIPENTSLVLNCFVLYVCLPAVILQKVPALTLSSQLLIPIITPWALLLCVAGIVLGLARYFNWSKQIVGALLIVVPLGNTSFLGFPMIEGFYGAEGMPYAVIYDQLGTFIALVIYTTIIAAMYGQSDTQVSWSRIALKILTFPAFVALLIALAIKGQTYPAIAQQVIDNLSGTLVPVVMISVGFSLKLQLDSQHRTPLFAGLTIKLILMPLIALLMWHSVGQDNLAVTVSVFASAMPPMISAGAVAMMAGLAPELVSALVGMGFIISLVTLPILHWLLMVM